MPTKGPFRWLFDLFGSVWLGISLAVLLFLYCSVGSAMPVVRQLPALEMTEFEWFHWWPFILLVLLLCANLIVVTVRRIPLRTVNLGVWMIHGGVIVLCLGSYYYFSTKVEGDTPVFRRHVRIELPGTDRPAYLPALPGAGTSVAAGQDRWQLQVQSTNSAWPILSDEHKGKTAYAVNVRVTPPSGDPFTRQLLAGYPQYTEDIIPGQGRAIKSLGRKLVNQEVKLSLEYEPQEYFHLMDTWALFVRRVGQAAWQQRPIHGLPRYHDRIGSRELVFTDPHHRPPVRALDLHVPASQHGDALASAEVRITGYLRYAHLRQRWRDGGDRLNPVLRASILTDRASGHDAELIALDPLRNRSEDGMMQFLWLDDSSLVETLPVDTQAMLHVEVPSASISLDVPITPETVVGRKGSFTPLEASGLAYRILNTQDNLAIPGKGRSVSVAMVEIQTPEGAFTRMVADQPEMTRDMRGDHADPHAAGGREPVEPDPRIHMTYRPQTAPVLFAAHPNGLFLAINGPSGRRLGREVRIGESVEVVHGLSVRADGLWTRATPEVRPYIVPPASRQRDAGETFSMIRVEVDTGHAIQSRWVRFSLYALANEQYAYSGRFAYAPERFHVPDVGLVEVVFSRERRRFPNPIALEDFALDAHVGGYTGQAVTIRNYVSKLRFLDQGEWTPATPIKVNAPTEYGGYWYFQSMWDKPPRGNPAGGMNYTGLGVGNRNGVYVQLAGCCLAVAGMLFAFYVKPILKRRSYGHSRAEARRSAGDEADQPVVAPLSGAVVEPVLVKRDVDTDDAIALSHSGD